jgi:hypothetical protein
MTAPGMPPALESAGSVSDPNRRGVVMVDLGQPVGRRARALAVHCLALVPGLAFLLVFVWRAAFPTPGGRVFTLFDDAMISMTYARTLADTGEWVWFPGADRVQGFTNPLWTLLMAGIHAVGLEGSNANLAVALVGVALIVVTGLLTGAFVLRALGPWPHALRASAVAAGSIPFLFPLTYWTLRGMEVGLLALLAIAVALAGLRTLACWRDGTGGGLPLALGGLAGALGVATRLDFTVVVAAVAGLLLVYAPSTRARASVSLLALAPAVVLALALLAFQHSYWGDWLPNTYRLKVEGFGLGERLVRGAAGLGKAAPVLVLTALSLWAALSRASGQLARRSAMLLTAIVAACAAYSMWAGGDAWETFAFMNRYVAVSLPAAVAVAIIGVSALLCSREPVGRGRLAAAIAAVVVSGIGMGVTTNPFGLNAAFATISVLGLVLLGTAAYLILRSATQAPDSTGRTTAALGTAALAMIVATSLVAGLRWIVLDAEYVRADELGVSEGRALAVVTQPGARIATIVAGGPAYYSGRGMVDLLGKSDRVIASGPRADVPPGSRYDLLYPGHNKWDYGHSIRDLRPDVVSQYWGGPEIRSQLEEWGYVEQCDADALAAYFREDSLLVRWDLLTACPEGRTTPSQSVDDVP